MTFPTDSDEPLLQLEKELRAAQEELRRLHTVGWQIVAWAMWTQEVLTTTLGGKRD